eukprot:EG_transcript_17000
MALAQAGRVLFDVGLVLGPTLGYVAQCLHVYRAQSSQGFSLAVPLVLLTASLLRVHFWWGRQFDPLLLWQALAMIVCQLATLWVCTSFPVSSQRGRSLLRGHFSSFWHWEDFASYLLMFLAAALGLTFLTLRCEHVPLYFEVVGYLSLLTEATLVVPQVWENGKQRSVEGLSLILVAAWVLGDGAKTAYFVLTGSPVQFLICGSLQLCLDAVIVLQFCLYRGRDKATRTETDEMFFQ